MQGYSSVLNPFIRWNHGELRWHDPETEHLDRLEAQARVRELEEELIRRDGES